MYVHVFPFLSVYQLFNTIDDNNCEYTMNELSKWSLRTAFPTRVLVLVEKTQVNLRRSVISSLPLQPDVLAFCRTAFVILII